ncbi:MAG: hypothetical protein E7088_04120 [Bacteroidales bacterium]|nr:hypothetical protein [Bacteroidales bacterium]
MKRYIYTLLFLLPFTLCGQNMYNYASFFGDDLTGTARFVGMGGSMGALGGDISVMGVNPAGTAIYRSSDISYTGSVDFNTNKATFGSDVVKSKNTRFSTENIGFVFANETDDSFVKYFNVGFSYRHKNNLYGEFDVCGISDGFSQQYTMDYLYRQNPFDAGNLSYTMYEDFQFSWLSLLGAEASLKDDAGNLFTYPDGLVIWEPTDWGYYSEERGGVNELDFNFSTNIKDRVYLGATIGVTNVDYSRYSYYFEADNNGEIYSLVNDYSVEGTGFNIKLGAIIRPFKYSPFKVGLYVHTPTWYELENISSASIADPYGNVIDTRDYELYNDDLRVKCSLSTPWRFGASMAYTFGKYLALNADYEYSDFSTAEFTKHTAVSRAQTVEIGRNMEAQHTVRVGAEFSFDGFSLRAGYSNVSAPFKTTAYKDMDNAAVTETSTEYMNRYEKDAVTLGFGLRGSDFYFDMAYMLQRQESDFYPYYDYEVVNPCATVKHLNHSVMATVGLRF